MTPKATSRPGSAGWPFWVASALYLGAVLLFCGAMLRQNGGRLVYPLDDPYIHMAIARNLASDGVWGVSRQEFSGASSSPLYTLLLAGAFWLCGAQEAAPLVVNVVCSLCLLYLLWRLLLRFIPGAPAAYIFMGLALATFATSLVNLTLLGMEHVLHALLVVAVVALAADPALVGSRRRSELLPLVSALAAATRYETCFAIAAICVLLVLKRERGLAGAVGLAALLPPAIYAWFSLQSGGYALPNPVVLKATHPQIHSLHDVLTLLSCVRGWGRLLATPALLVPVVLSLPLVVIPPLGARPATLIAALAAAAILLHLQFAEVGWGYRYEAYLVLLGILALTTSWYELLRWCRRPGLRLAAWAVFAAAVVPLLALRGYESTTAFLIPASRNIHEQQYQMGLFLKAYYRGETVAANDIGAVCLLGDVRCVDLYGLGTNEVARRKVNQAFHTRAIQEITAAADTRIAIVYDHWFQGERALPTAWRKCGEWTIAGNVVCGGDTVSFYAVAPEESAPLRRALRQFAPELPAGVTWRGP